MWQSKNVNHYTMAFVSFSPALKIDHWLGVISKISSASRDQFLVLEKGQSKLDLSGFPVPGRWQDQTLYPSPRPASVFPGWRAPTSQPASPSVKWGIWPISVFPQIQLFVKEPPLSFLPSPMSLIPFSLITPSPAVDWLTFKTNVFGKETFIIWKSSVTR